VKTVLQEFGDLAGYQHAQLLGELQKLTGTRQALVDLPDERVQLGGRWPMILVTEQLIEAQKRGLLDPLLSGDDPDEAPADDHTENDAA
jgi:hypothetical protein